MRLMAKRCTVCGVRHRVRGQRSSWPRRVLDWLYLLWVGLTMGRRG